MRPVNSTKMTDFSQLSARIAPQMKATEAFLRAQVGEFEPEIQEMAEYCLSTSGKRLRPILVFTAGWQGDGVFNEGLVRAAAVVEMVHLATLVHDDIMDGAEKRRNRDTVVHHYGANPAVLLGDALFAQALHVAAQFPTTEVCRLVSQSTRRVCSGEIMQTLRRRRSEVRMEDYRRVIDLKTAELFRTSCYLGARLGGGTDEYCRAAESFGRSLGIAYQIYDDLVDVAGLETEIGKTLGTDWATGKLTLPLMLLLERLPDGERSNLLGDLDAGTAQAGSISKSRLTSLGVLTSVADAIEREINLALVALAPFEDRESIAMMAGLADFLRTQVSRLAVRG